MKKTLILLPLIFFLVSTCKDQGYTSSEISHKAHQPVIDSIRMIVEQRMYERSIPSISIGLILDGEIVYLEGFGVLDRTKNVAATANSIYQIASVSKTYTGIIAHGLLQDGLIDLDKTVSYYLNDELDEKSKERFKNTKVKHLLQHSAGIPNYGFSVYPNWNEKSYWTKGFSKEELLAELSSLVPEFESGSKYKYSNAGYALLGLILEVASNKTSDELLNQYISGKYKLSDTRVHLTNEQRERLAMPYRPDNRMIMIRDSKWGLGVYSSGFYASVADMTQLLLKQMQAYQGQKKLESISPLILNDLVGLDNEVQIFDGHTLNYGMGFMKYDVNNGQKIVYQHAGDSDGYGSLYFFDVTKSYGMVILTSSCGLDFQRLTAEIGAVVEKEVYGKK